MNQPTPQTNNRRGRRRDAIRAGIDRAMGEGRFPGRFSDSGRHSHPGQDPLAVEPRDFRGLPGEHRGPRQGFAGGAPFDYLRSLSTRFEREAHHLGRRHRRHERTADMARMVANCPSCDGALEVRRLECPACGVGVEGHFESGPLARLTRDQLTFVETFLRCRGKIKDVEVELGISYPTVVTRLNEVLVAMGFEAGEDPREAERRQKVLDDLSNGRISATEAAEKLRQMGG